MFNSNLPTSDSIFNNICVLLESLDKYLPQKHVGKFLHSQCMRVPRQWSGYISTLKINNMFTGQMINK